LERAPSSIASSQPRGGLHIIVEEDDQIASRGSDTSVTGPVDPLRLGDGNHSCLVERGGGVGGRICAIVDNDHLGTCGARLRYDRSERDFEILRSASSWDDDRSGRRV
jgi:hypothetical protein